MRPNTPAFCAACTRSRAIQFLLLKQHLHLVDNELNIWRPARPSSLPQGHLEQAHKPILQIRHPRAGSSSHDDVHMAQKGC